MLSVWAQGRFRYYRIADDDVASLIENLVNLAAKTAARLPRRDVIADELRQSRSCYCHLAGRLGVLLSEALVRRRLVTVDGREGQVTKRGIAWCGAERIDFHPSRSPHLRLCNDWTERVPHFSGAFPNAILTRLTETRCLESAENSARAAADAQGPRLLRPARRGGSVLSALWKRYGLSSTPVSGRSLPEAVSVCHLPSEVSYWITSVRPGVRCSAAARLAAASAVAWLSKCFREHAVDRIGPAAVVLDDLVGDMGHREPAWRVTGQRLTLWQIAPTM